MYKKLKEFGDDYTLVQSEDERNEIMEIIYGKGVYVSGMLVKFEDGEYKEVWGVVSSFPYFDDVEYERLW